MKPTNKKNDKKKVIFATAVVLTLGWAPFAIAQDADEEDAAPAVEVKKQESRKPLVQSAVVSEEARRKAEEEKILVDREIVAKSDAPKLAAEKWSIKAKGGLTTTISNTLGVGIKLDGEANGRLLLSDSSTSDGRTAIDRAHVLTVDSNLKLGIHGGGTPAAGRGSVQAGVAALQGLEWSVRPSQLDPNVDHPQSRLRKLDLSAKGGTLVEVNYDHAGARYGSGLLGGEGSVAFLDGIVGLRSTLGLGAVGVASQRVGLGVGVDEDLWINISKISNKVCGDDAGEPCMKVHAKYHLTRDMSNGINVHRVQGKLDVPITTLFAGADVLKNSVLETGFTVTELPAMYTASNQGVTFEAFAGYKVIGDLRASEVAKSHKAALQRDIDKKEAELKAQEAEAAKTQEKKPEAVPAPADSESESSADDAE